MEDWTYQEHYDMEDRHWWFRSRRRVIWALIDRAGLPASPRILDAGCGTGRNLMEFAQLGPAEGVDLSPQAVEFCHRRGLDGVRQAAIEQLPFEDGRFDLLFATDVIEHLAGRRTRADGAAPGGRPGGAPDHHRARLQLALEPARHVLAPLPPLHAPAAARARERATAGSPRWQPTSTAACSRRWPWFARSSVSARDGNGNGKSDLHLSPSALDRCLELPVRGEAELIKRGVSLPAGVSLGMVCTVR